MTIDSKDYAFNARLYRIAYKNRVKSIPEFKKRYLDYIWKQTVLAEKSAKKVPGQPVRQILLIHANLLNSYCLGDIIELYKKNGYKFITLKEALNGNEVKSISDSNLVPIPREFKTQELSLNYGDSQFGEIPLILT